MSQFYQNMQKTASGLLKKFGTIVTMRRTVPGEYDPGTGRRTGDAAVEWTPKAVKTGISEKYQGGYTSLGASTGGTRIEAGDMALLVDCKGQPHIPAKGDKVTFANGETWSIMEDTPVDPAGVVVLYKGIIRKG
jgi:hypothetical protein